MKVLLFGATGMVGQGVLRECLLDPGVEAVLAVGRRSTGRTHDKLRDVVREDLFDLSTVEGHLSGFDACFFCLGVSSVGMAEDVYERLTYALTLAVARPLARLNPGMRFVYVSGMGTDGTERGRVRWARVKGRTENALLQLPFEAYMFRPAFIQPQHGIRSKTRLYQAVYSATAPLLPILRRALPRYVTTTDEIARAMVVVARNGWRTRVLENRDINEAARSATRSS